MKIKEIIEHFKQFDPESDIYIGEVRTKDSLKIQCISNILLKDSNGILDGIYLILNGNTPMGESYIKNIKPKINIEL